MSSATVCQASSGKYPSRPRLPGNLRVSSAATIWVRVNPAASSAVRRFTNQARWTAVPW